ncbi:tripartite tricarboxylate transporter substrate binding protein [uncultured Hydrogenophaga sp.]|uniref:Bug family tripartite tricarboxylate transporter substrate binding protein n=1 Tax=uncultured Hydrogenophaga sp. TaxID=199683 RepID=UPI00258AE722|nr:tripartite tricarboxylate transporter substrate binding protein [uncultured Hydrogenophaga sp.]
MPTFTRRSALVTALLGLLAPHAFGQTYPSKPITLVVPYPAGAAVDNIGRGLALELSKRLGQSVVVENVGGASGTIGAGKVRRSTPDGYTLMVGTVNELLVAPTVMKSGYSVSDFTPIAKISSNSTVLVAHPGFSANSADELIEQARRSKEPLLMGATGAAVMQTVGGMLLAEAGGIEITNVVYKGGAPMVTDLLAGQVLVGTVALNSVLPHIRNGKLKPLGVISNHRDPTAPEIPTINEGKAVKNVEADLWTGLVGPKDLPPPVVSRLTAVMRDILSEAKYRESQLKAGSIPADPEAEAVFSRFVLGEKTRLAPVLAKVKVE